jgi:cell division protein FtsZ
VTLLDPKLENLKYEMQDEEDRPTARIKVIGIGGGGANAVAHMMASGLDGAEFYVLNTDVQALRASPVPNKLAIGCRVTNGRGAGADPEVGKQAALEDTECIVELLQGADMVFVTAGLGSGTGTGAAPIISAMAKELNALTVAVVTMPFAFEGARRLRQAEEGLAKLASSVDTVITISNERLLELAPRGTSILEAFRMGHDFLYHTVQDLVEIVTMPGFINRDYADLRTTLFGMGRAVLGTATARGENAAVEAARQAIACPLIDQAGIQGARNVLLNVTGSSRLGLHEVNDACQLIRKATENDDVQLNFGLAFNESMADAVKVTLIATSFAPRKVEPEHEPEQSAAEPPNQPLWLSDIEMVEPEPAPEPEPVPVAVEAKAGNGTAPLPETEDLDDLDTPAYLRQGRVLR